MLTIEYRINRHLIAYTEIEHIETVSDECRYRYAHFFKYRYTNSSTPGGTFRRGQILHKMTEAFEDLIIKIWQ